MIFEKSIIKRILLLFIFVLLEVSCSSFQIKINPNLKYSEHLTYYIDKLSKRDNLDKFDWQKKEIFPYLANYSIALDLAVNNYYEVIDKDELEDYVEEAVRANFFGSQVEQKQIIELATNTIFEKLDDKSGYLNSEISQIIIKAINQGLYPYNKAKMVYDQDSIVIEGFYKYSQWKNSGLEIGDKIIQVNDTKYSQDSKDEIALLFLVVDDLNLIVTTKDGNRKTINIKNNRQSIDENYFVTSKVINHKNNIVLYFRIDFFSNNLQEVFFKEFYSMIKKHSNYKAIIFDLRYNPGGLGKASSYISDKFIAKGVPFIVYKTRGETFITESRFEPVIDDDIRIAILVNGQTASAAESLTKVLSSQRAAIIVGEETYGKSSYQNTVPAYLNRIFMITSGKFSAYANNYTFDSIKPDFTIKDDPSTPDIDEALNLAINKLVN